MNTAFLPTILFLAAPLLHAEVSYTLVPGHETWPAKKKAAIVKCMNEAVALYNKHSELTKKITVNYDPRVPTANGSSNGRINFGGSISTRIALHEISHTLGIGTTRRYRALLKNGKWQGEKANALLRTFEGEDAVLSGDRQHFWPYGLNFDRETRELGRKTSFLRHVKMVAALHQDMFPERQ